MMSSNRQFLLYSTTALLLFLGGCSRGKITADAVAHQVEVVQVDKILFLTLSAQVLPGNDVPVFEVIQKQVVNGTLKAKPFQDAQVEIGGYKVSLLNSDFEEVASQFVADPLHLHAEIAQDDGKLVRQDVELTYAEVPLRFSWKGDALYLSIFKVQEPAIFLELARLPLSPEEN